ncbi:VENN motif pre-toxin domain-containing protein, partial [Ursidibacter sp. B-7004-1]
EHKQNSNQLGLGTHLEFGFGSSWQFSGNASLEGGRGNSKQVLEQSGFFAEDSYNVNADKVHLVGGAIASQNPANSELTTNQITFSDIHNQSDYSATSGAISGGYGQTKGTSINPTLPLHEQGNDQSVTRATLTEGKITLNKDSNPTITTAAALGINTHLAEANRQVEQPKDITLLLGEQKVISQNLGHISTAAVNFADKQAKEAEQEKQTAEKELAKAKASGDSAKISEKQTAYDEANVKMEAWGEGGSKRRQINTAVAVMGAILTGKSTAQTAAIAVSPELNAKIHELTKESKSANLLAHAALSAVEFYAAGLDPTTGALAGVASEGSAMFLSEKVFGKTAEQLTAEERNLLKAASQLAGAVVGGVVGNSTATTVEGMATAKRAVENNYLYRHEAEELLNLRLILQRTTDPKEREKIQVRIDKLEELDQERQEHIKTVCPDFGKSSSACSAAITDAEKAKASYNGWTDQYQPVSYNSKDKRPYSTVFTRDYSRVNEALEGKDELTRQKEELAIDLAKSGKMSKEEAYRILDNSMTLSDTLIALGGIKTVSNEKLLAFLTGKYKLPVIGKTQGYEYSNVSISSGAENVALYPKLKEQLMNENLINIGKSDPKLKEVSDGIGKNLNYGISGISSIDDSNRLGKLWVGEGYSTSYEINSHGQKIPVGLMSADGLRGYRFPSEKPNSKWAITGIQANFETYKINPINNKREKIGNAHLNIQEK